MAEFTDQDLHGSSFTNVDLSGSAFRGVDLNGVRMRGVELVDVRIDGEVEQLVVNGVDVAPLVEAELDPRDPDRARMRPVDADGFREAWRILERLWAGTVERARALSPEQLHASVDDEWSFIETLRHLMFATDSWVGRMILGDRSPWHPLDLPWDEAPDFPGVPRDRTARPSLAEVLPLRDVRVRGVREYLAELTDDVLDTEAVAPDGEGWPQSGRSFPIRQILLIILNEEYHHRLFAERDLDALSSAR